MNDDDATMRDEQASAYLDGELDASERAAFTADPEAMALVDSFAQVRRALGEFAPVADDVRAAALAAALAEFDAHRQVAPVAPAPAARVTMLHTRWQRSYRVLRGVAVAAAVIAVVAVAALNAPKGSDSKSSSGTVPLDASTPRVEMATGSAAADGAPAATTAAAGTAAPAANDKVAAATVPPEINNADQLAQYATTFLSAGSAPAEVPQYSGNPAATEMTPMPALPPSTCLNSSDTVLGPISVLGSPAYALRDNSTGIVRAIDANDCHVFFSTGP